MAEPAQSGAPSADVLRVRLRLYVLRGSAPSETALANFKALADNHLGGRYHLELIDVADEPMRALRDGVLITPTLIRLTPPMVWVVGDLTDTEAVVRALLPAEILPS